MNTTNILNNTSATQWETIKPVQTEPRQLQSAPPAEAPVQSDSVNVNTIGNVQPTLLADEDVEAVMEETLSMIAEDPYAALHVHSGLDAARVAALLA